MERRLLVVVCIMAMLFVGGCDRVQGLVKGDAKQYLEKGLQFIEIGDEKLALEQFNAAIKEMPKNAKAYYYKGLCLAELNDGVNSEAIDSVEIALKIDPAFADLHGNFLMAGAWEHLKDKERAFQEYQKFANRFSQSENANVPVALEKMAAYEADRGNFTQALANLVTIRDKYTDYRNIDAVKVGIARLDFSINSGVYEKRIQENPNDFEARYKYGALNYDNGLKDEGLKQIEISLGINENYEAARHKYAEILVDKGELDKAIKAYEKLVAVNPQEAKYHNEIAGLYKKQDKFEKAIDSYKNSIALNKDKDVMFELAYLCYKTDRKADSRNYFKEYVILDPMGGKRVEIAKSYIERLSE